MGVRLSAENISKSYGSHDVFVDATFGLQGHSICGVIGNSGSGKTTLLRSMVGFVPLDDGSLTYWLDDVEYSNLSQKKLLRHFGFASQQASVYMKLTVLENLAYFASIYGLRGKKMKERIAYCLELVGLTQAKDQVAYNLSEGMLKRLDLACSIVHDPHVLLLDEPMADLDAQLRQQLWSLIKDIRDTGKLVIISSHILEDLDLYCDALVMVHNSKIHFFADVDEMLQSYDGVAIVRARVDNQEKLLSLLERNKKLEIVDIRVEPHVIEIESTNYAKVFHGILSLCKKNNISVLDIEFHQKTMQSLFEAVIREHDGGLPDPDQEL